ncbi:hypothetical protein AMAG_14953 [Allomyces macrogynus ATCC 38327]|uniref:Uncharacterized protein n=1 Tax=Allomyces macrogynus (strain ATCC 38327) TaxID=578462 RepID=A0A0L0T818_ALLM3|nr:hypothetical protein, variant [Allomyces macrogynus ATCC 38327]KNE70841.1 hypothetical protein AMAG_14953 [Allomyces macrogynus ATCC 38327]|eukprot:KNE70840.1 hypothetical protein, variant [Allomyces macrogynus ATCC 38327]
MRSPRRAACLQNLPLELIETIVTDLVDPLPAVQAHPSTRLTQFPFGEPRNLFALHQLQGHAAPPQGLNPLAQALGMNAPPPLVPTLNPHPHHLFDPFAQLQGIDAPVPLLQPPQQNIFQSRRVRLRPHLTRPLVTAPDRPWTVLQLSWTCRSARAAVLRRLLASNAFAIIDGDLSTSSDGSEPAARVNVRICLAKQSHAAFEAAMGSGRQQLPWCSIEIVPPGTVAAPAAPGPLVDRTLRVPAAYITALQFVRVHAPGLDASLWPTTCTMDRIADVLPSLRRVYCHFSLPAGHTNSLLNVVKDRTLKLTLDSQDAAWIASVSFPILQTLVLRRSMTARLIAAVLPSAPVLRVLRLAAGCRVHNPNLLLSSFPWLEVLVAEEGTSSGPQTAEPVDPVVARLSGQGFDSRLTQVQVTSHCLREWITPTTAAAVKSLVILGSLRHESPLPDPAAMTKLTSLVMRADDAAVRYQGKSIMVHHLVVLAQLPSLQVFEGDVIESDLPPRNVFLGNNSFDPVTAAFGRVQEQIATLDAPFSSLVTVKSSPLFFLVLEQLTLSRLAVAEINFTSPHPIWAARKLVLPALPSIDRLCFTPDTPTSEVDAWILSDPTLWATQMPRLGQLHCRASCVELSGLSHPVLHELTMSISSWKLFVAQPAHLPNLNYLALTGGMVTTLRPIMSGGALARVARLSLRTRQITWAVATDLTRARGLFDIRCRALLPIEQSDRELMSGTPRVKLIRSQGMNTLRLEYTPINSAAWGRCVPARSWPAADVPEIRSRIDVPGKRRDARRGHGPGVGGCLLADGPRVACRTTYTSLCSLKTRSTRRVGWRRSRTICARCRWALTV